MPPHGGAPTQSKLGASFKNHPAWEREREAAWEREREAAWEAEFRSGKKNKKHRKNGARSTGKMGKTEKRQKSGRRDSLSHLTGVVEKDFLLFSITFHIHLLVLSQFSQFQISA